jgi:flagellar basal body P-ring protein FlgI
MLEIIVDENMKYLLLEKKWRISHFGYAVHSYREASKVKTIRIHRVILGVTDPKVIIDHINGNKLDNRKCNLRIVTVSQNAMNSKKTNKPTTSIYKGVSKCSDRDKYIAMIKHNGKRLNLGRFNTEVEAALAYNIAAKKYFGEYAKINEII